MDKKLTISPIFKYISLSLFGIGVITVIFGLMSNPVKTWANLLMSNYYFLSIAIGASFFAAIQYISQSGWSSAFVRIPQAITSFIPVAGILMLPIILFGLPDLYHWAHHDAVEHDALIAHKSPYLNTTFFIARYALFFIVWTFLNYLLRRYSLKEDQEGGLKYFQKSEFYSKVYIFVLAITFSLASFDWIMSIDVHWFSTIFAVRNFVMGFYHGSVIIVMVIIILNKTGYLPFLNKSHLRDFSKYILILGVIWAYTWFSQYILIWYANIPEETIYYLPRTKGEFQFFFYAELIINWLVPFVLLLSGKIATNKNALLAICILLMFGQWVDLYQQVIVGTYGILEINYIEVGTFIGYLGIFAFVVAWSLAKAPLVARNHPYLEESLHHH